MSATHLSLAEFRALLDRYGFHPSKSRGQNFLYDTNLARAIVAQAKLKGEESVLEIGTGCGYLTAAIAEKARRVLTVEIDERLSQIAQQSLSLGPEVEFFVGDFLAGKKINPELESRLKQFAPFQVIANLPYSVGASILAELCLFQPAIPQMVVMLQKEVADRCQAGPGSRERGPLTVLVQRDYRVSWLRKVPPGVFWPRPQVDSAVILLERISPTRSVEETERFQRLVSSLFQNKRKQLQKGFQRVFGDSYAIVARECQIDLKLRPESLTREQWEGLARHAPAQLPKLA